MMFLQQIQKAASHYETALKYNYVLQGNYLPPRKSFTLSLWMIASLKV